MRFLVFGFGFCFGFGLLCTSSQGFHFGNLATIVRLYLYLYICVSVWWLSLPPTPHTPKPPKPPRHSCSSSCAGGQVVVRVVARDG